MSDVQKGIRDWLHERQDWLQEAAEKLLGTGDLTEVEVQAITDRLKTPAGQKTTAHRTFDGLASGVSAATELRLVELGDIVGIENLAPRRPLTFGTGNLVVIYGNNGSGKSGYTRILKKASGKPRAERLKPNLFENLPATQQCRITYCLAGANKSVLWQADGGPIDDIRAVDVFDMEAASRYLEEEAEATNAPPSVALFLKLASTSDRVKAKLQQEQDRLVSTLAALPTEYLETAFGKLYGALTLHTEEKAIQGLEKWDEDDDKSLAQLTERLKTTDPASLAQKERATKAQLDGLATQLKNVSAAVGKEQVESVRNARTDALDKRRIATESAQVGSAQLDGIGSTTWNALWQAAREYSQTAYFGQEFPVVGDGARCVLCHQELEKDAPQRLLDFEAFVQGAVEGSAKVAEETYRDALDSLPAIPSGGELRTRCEAAGLSEKDWTEALENFWAKVDETCRRLRDGEAEEKAVAVESPDELLEKLAERSKILEHNAQQHEKDAKSFDRDKATADKLNLEARRWTAQQAVAIRAEIGRLKTVKTYEEWKQLANSASISRKGGKVAELVITKAYVGRFNDELEALGASRVKVELIKTRTEKGRALHRLRLRGVRAGQDAPASILSDGERRIVALAAFLADVAEKSQAAPFIFDDPISSLDQEFEWRVATRLVRLARSRQVLVFTHRLSLFGAMEDAAGKVGKAWSTEHLFQNFIESFGGAAGHPADEKIWSVNTKKANNILLARLDVAKKAGESGGAEAYRIPAQGICTEFRKLLERTVEDDLLNRIVRRHRRSITTDNRLAPLSQITREDCKLIDDLMTKYSCYEHSQSQEAPRFLPEEPELRGDLESLQTWRENFRERPAEAGA